MTTEDDFQRKLRRNPRDWHTRLVFADWLEERGDPRAEGYRALGTLRLLPVRDRTRGGWNWGETVTGSCYGCKLKSYWFAKLPKVWIPAPSGFHESRAHWGAKFATRREAEDAAALAFAELPQGRRAELLKAKGAA